MLVVCEPVEFEKYLVVVQGFGKIIDCFRWTHKRYSKLGCMSRVGSMGSNSRRIARRWFFVFFSFLPQSHKEKELNDVNM